VAVNGDETAVAEFQCDGTTRPGLYQLDITLRCEDPAGEERLSILQTVSS
jgi:hypothetical protein